LKNLIIGIVVLAAFVSGIALAQVATTWSETKTANQFRIDSIHIVPYVKDCSAQYTFLNEKNEAVASRTLSLVCKDLPGIVNMTKYVNAQIGLKEGKTFPDPVMP
jgi:hypothetical protein